jgi:hypothetical protein
MKYFDKLYDELLEISDKIRKWYDIDKVKTHSVYIWTKGSDGENVFDIFADEIELYDKNHIIIEESKSVIEEIQQKLREIEEYRNLPADFNN